MKRTYLTLIILMLVIGFAAVTANLVINGTINFGFNQKDFDDGVIFTYTNTMHGDAKIINGGKSITFTTTKLETLNEQSILDFDIANKSSQYDASVTIKCGLEDDFQSYSEYVDIKQNLGNDPFQIASGGTKSGRLTITLKKAYDQEEKDINMICTIVATPGERTTEGKYEAVEHEYEEILLNGADPVLEVTPVEAVSLEAGESNKKLIPVIISEEDGTVTRADTTKEWYDYETKKWANAVILVDGVKDPGANKEIPEDNIESYFVWIPKYRYKLWNVNTTNPTHNGPFTIEIEFGTEDTEDNETECVAPNESGATGRCENGKWMTHPAFTSFGVDGFWVGKFEVGYQGANSSTEAEVDEENSAKVTIKPDEYSWRKVTNKNMFNSLKKYASNLDSHMMKNTEWGAVAYLSHSKYGINNEVAQNTNPEYKTGYAKSGNTIVPYNSADSIKASTTGNYSGIYDMSGGAWERVAAYRDVANETDAIGESGFTKRNIIDIGERYFDVYYKDTVVTSYDKRILGDATGEMGPFSSYRGSWYRDYAKFVESAAPWFSRGGDYSDNSGSVGQFHFDRHSGGVSVYHSSRLVLSPQ